jgi:hypothetical protein
MGKYTLFLVFGCAWAQLQLPSWLVPFPGAVPSPVKASAGLAETSYIATAQPEEILAHYRALFAAANLRFNPNFDGLGTTVRAAAPECDLLLKIRDQSSGTSVKISCAAKTASLAGAPISGSETGSAGARVPPAFPHRSFEEIRQEQEERGREMRAKFDADARAGVASVSQYDRPVRPGEQKKTQPDPAPGPAPVWPHWLIAIGSSDGCTNPTASNQHGQSAMHCQYKTSAPMSKLHQSYLDLIKANGFILVSSSISTLQTISGVKQNATGYIDCMRKTDDQPTGPSVHVKVSYNRFYLDEPITVSLGVTWYPGLQHR